MSSTTSTAGLQHPPAGSAPASVVALLRRVEENPVIDGPARALAALARTVAPTAGVSDALRGTWLGHALHPLLTDFPLGAWMSASLLDLVGGPEARGPARRLVGFGLLAAVPTVASGLAEWQDTGGRSRRVGVVHAAVNATATTLYLSSWLARRRSSHRVAVGLGVAGGLVATLGGYFGGHLTLVRKIGTTDAAFGTEVSGVAPTPPKDR
ncbi:MAG: DUF2231 domain-containing protein [Acidimicrobiia bacterium]